MTVHRMLSATIAAALVLAPVLSSADDASSSVSSSSSSSSSSSASSVDGRTGIRVERCARFAKGDDYERCVRLIRRIPLRETGSSSSVVSSASSMSFESDAEWKWGNVLKKMEEKVNTMVKYSSVMAKKFCRDQTDDITATSQECMLRMKNEMQVRVAALIDEAFRGALPSSR
jgi:flagellar hook-basal body complex protein FliE